MTNRDLVVVGASAGGIQALTALLGGLEPALPIAILVVVHSSPDAPGVLPLILGRASSYPVDYAHDGEPIEHGRVYVAPPDRHLMVTAHRLVVQHGPVENRFRPAVDPLFRSAGETYGERVIAVILSGALGDGTHGLAVVKQHGGIAVVQTPDDAMVPNMPSSALRSVKVDHVVPVSEMPELIATLAAPSARRAPARASGSERVQSNASGNPGNPGPSAMPGEADEPPVALTCPECGGALRELDDLGVLRYRCHVGHGITADGLALSQTQGIERTLWSALRALEEHAHLRRRMSLRARKGRMDDLAATWDVEAAEAEDRANEIRGLLSEPPASAAPARRRRR